MHKYNNVYNSAWSSSGAGIRDFFSGHDRAINQNLILPFKVRLGQSMEIICLLTLVWGRTRQLGPLT